MKSNWIVACRCNSAVEVVLLGTPAAKMLEVLSLATSSPQAYTSISSRPPLTLVSTSLTIVVPPQVPIAGVTLGTSSEKLSAVEEGKASTSSDPEGTPAKWCKITPMPLLVKSHTVSKLPSIVVPKLVVLTHALPEQFNCPGDCKHYKCWICVFQHTNRDCMLMHIWQHLELSVGCPMCGKGFQHAAYLCKHGQKVYSVNIVESEHE